ncbi:MAG: RNA polymerase sigma factor [Planctomycetota bacterium]|jgi:RNA polymerase sigma-70 factor (ECF subfamily)
MEDKLLVLRCKRGSRDALERIYEKYKDDLLILAIALLNETSAAEDVLHDVFVTFVQGIEKFRLTGSLKGYLLTCVANRARNKNKARHLNNKDLDQAELISTGANDPSNSVICNEQLQQLRNALTKLPYEQRQVILLHLKGAMTFRAIAGQQGIAVNTVKSRYRYGLDKLWLILNHEAER